MLLFIIGILLVGAFLVFGYMVYWFLSSAAERSDEDIDVDALYNRTLLIEAFTGGAVRFMLVGLIFFSVLGTIATLLGLIVLAGSLTLALSYSSTELPSVGYSWVFIFSFIAGSIAAGANIAASYMAYNGNVGGGGFTRFVLGARQPSRRELEQIRDVYSDVLEAWKGDKSQLVGFSDEFVLDNTLEIAYTIGTTLYISSGCLRSRHLPVIMAQEIGHNQYKHGGIVLALRMLTFPLFWLFVRNIRNFSTKFSGGYKLKYPRM